MNGTLVINGVEDAQGRALFVISALYHCADFLRDRVVRFIDVRSLDVEIAAEVLAFDTGLKVEVSKVKPEADSAEAFRDALLYAAVVFDDMAGLGLSCAGRRGIRQMVAVQFPRAAELTAECVARLSAAHDPAIFAEALRAALA